MKPNATQTAASRLAKMMAESPFHGYAYAYPHKSAYRPLTPSIPLAEAWATENLGALFLYIHVPFCEVRCAFCNLFTTVKPRRETIDEFLGTLRRQAERTQHALETANARHSGTIGMARLAIGGGTPTFLDAAGLDALFDVAERIMGAECAKIPVAVEGSPDTVTPEKLAVLKARGTTRISLGVQSFDEAETRAVGRPQPRAVVENAIAWVREFGFAVLNLDLIYGLPGQTRESWRRSVETTLAYRPEEIFLYPLYKRPLTGLGLSAREWDDVRLACYRDGRDMLLAAGYRQISMRLFRLGPIIDTDGPAYCCQRDGMIGLGAGARSYTCRLHYATEYAVRPKPVRAIIADYLARPTEAFDRADYGFVLDDDETRRRFIIQGLLHETGLDFMAYQAHFGTDARADFPELADLVTLALAVPWPNEPFETAMGLRLSTRGLECSDIIGPWLYSPAVTRRSADFAAR